MWCWDGEVCKVVKCGASVAEVKKKRRGGLSVDRLWEPRRG